MVITLKTKEMMIIIPWLSTGRSCNRLPELAVQVGREHLSRFQILKYYGHSSTVERDFSAKSCKTTQHVEAVAWSILLA